MSLALVEKHVENPKSGGSWHLSGHNGDVLSIATSGSDVFATCDVRGVGLLWKHHDLIHGVNRAYVGKIETGGPAIVDACFLHHTCLCTAQGDGTVGVWNVETAQQEQSLCRASGRGRSHDWPVINAVSALNGTLLAYGGDDGFLVVGDPAQNGAAATTNLRVPIMSLATSKDSLYVGDVLGNIRCFDVRMMRSIYSFRGHHDPVSCVTLNKDLTMMVSYGMDNMLALWDVMPFALSTSSRLLHRIHMYQGDSQSLLRCGWSKKDTILVPTGEGHIVCVTASLFGGTNVSLPVRHQKQPAQCAVFLDDDVAVSSAGAELILQRV